VLLLLGAPAQLCRAYDLSCPTCATSHATAVATSVSVPASSNNVATRDWVTYDLCAAHGSFLAEQDRRMSSMLDFSQRDWLYSA
jgi:hypothetical protein